MSSVCRGNLDGAQGLGGVWALRDVHLPLVECLNCHHLLDGGESRSKVQPRVGCPRRSDPGGHHVADSGQHPHPTEEFASEATTGPCATGIYKVMYLDEC